MKFKGVQCGKLTIGLRGCVDELEFLVFLGGRKAGRSVDLGQFGGDYGCMVRR